MDNITGTRPPGMRRKSSASNLLATFQSTRSNSSASIGPHPPPPSSFTAPPASAIQTPTMEKWDASSLFSDSTALSSTTTLVGSTNTVATSATLGVPSSFEAVRETLNRRLLALAHIRQGHEGKSHWLNTVYVGSYELEKAYSNPNMRKRTYKFAILGMSLSNLFDIQTPSDFLRSLTTLLGEYEQLQDEHIKPRMRNILRGNKPRKAGAGSINDEESSYLVVPNMPFPLDYFQVTISFCDILMEVYHKIRGLVGTSPLGHSGMANSVPPGSGYAISLQSPTTYSNPVYAQLFTPMDHGPGIYAASPDGGQSGLASPPPTWSPSLAESIMKVDSRFKKIINTLLKEFDTMARASIKDELSSLDPFLRNVGSTGVAGAEGGSGMTFDFDV